MSSVPRHPATAKLSLWDKKDTAQSHVMAGKTFTDSTVQAAGFLELFVPAEFPCLGYWKKTTKSSARLGFSSNYKVELGQNVPTAYHFVNVINGILDIWRNLFTVGINDHTHTPV